jgi:glycosyltransferase involved in cell wall biosynthesis
VSVIVPAYRVTPYIAEALDSVLAQSYADYELIVVNDGCPDSVALEAALRRYLDRIVYVKKDHGGVSSARNAGIRVAQAPLIALLDGDDAWMPDYLAVQTDYLRAHPQTDIVYGNAVLIGDSPVSGRRAMDLSPSHGEVTLESLVLRRCTVFTSSVLARKAAIVGVGGFDESLQQSEDFDLWVRAVHAGVKISYHEQVIYRRRARKAGLSADGVVMGEAALTVLKRLSQTLALSVPETSALTTARQAFQADVDYLRMKRSLHTKDVPAALGELGRMLQVHWTLRHALLGVALLCAPRLTLRVSDWRERQS